MKFLNIRARLVIPVVFISLTLLGITFLLLGKRQMNNARELFGLFLAVSGILLLLTMTLTFLFERKFLRPIRNLTVKLGEISRGGFTKPASFLPAEENDSSNEIRMLTDSCNKMIASLQICEKELQKAKAALKEVNEQLEAKVAERTQELRAAKEKAEESDLLKSAFLANMSHEIRTPLNAIVGFTEILVSDHSDPETRSTYIHIIEENTECLLNLIEDILDLSKLETGTLTIKPEKVNLDDFAQDIYRNAVMMRDRMEKQSVQIELKRQPDRMAEQGFFDFHRIKQVILNLVNNALKFTDSGNIIIGIEKRNKDCFFYVSDSGVGIDPKDKDMVFNRFYKNESSERLYKGTGLGLAICKSMIDLSGGKIWLESEAGKGTTFYFTLPADSYFPG